MVFVVVSGMSALLIGLFFNGPFWLFIKIALIWGFTAVADSAQFSSVVTELADRSMVGSALAFEMGVGFALTIFVIWLLPVLAEHMGSWRWSFVYVHRAHFLVPYKGCCYDAKSGLCYLLMANVKDSNI